MFKFLRVGVVALLALALTVPLAMSTAKPAHAVGPACWASDALNVVYDDWYATNYQQVYDTNRGVYFNMNTDIRSYRLSGSDNRCYRGYYTSVWSSDGAVGEMGAHLRMWSCGTYLGGEQDARSANVSRIDVVSGQNGAPVAGVYYTNVNGVNRAIGFYDYGQTPCNPQADNLYSYGKNSLWAPNTVQSTSPHGAFWIGW